jgi:hypothetical protein
MLNWLLPEEKSLAISAFAKSMAERTKLPLSGRVTVAQWSLHCKNVTMALCSRSFEFVGSHFLKMAASSALFLASVTVKSLV